MNLLTRSTIVRIALPAAFLLLTGCNETLRTTVEDGIITSSTALLGSALQAVIAVVQEGA